MTSEEICEKQFDVIVANIWQLWELYIKFYVFANTVNIAALGLAVQYIDPKQRGLIIFVFSILNVLLVLTSVFISRHSKAAGERCVELLKRLESPQVESSNSTLNEKNIPYLLPSQFLNWAGYANAIGSIVLIGCWIYTPWIEKPFFTK